MWEQLLADVRGHIWGSGDFSKLAEKADVSPQTVSKFAYGETKSPHMRTVFKIMDALGKSEEILTAFKSEKPVSTRSAIARKTGLSKRRALIKERGRPKATAPHVRASVRRAAEELVH